MIYLDNQSTTQLDPRVLQAMLPTLEHDYANPSNVLHDMGLDAARWVEDATASIAQQFDCSPLELVHTSGATESNHLAIFGTCLDDQYFAEPTRGHVVTAATEHQSVLGPIDQLQKFGYRVTILPVAANGRPNAGQIDLDQLADALRPDTRLVSLMLVNNEIGVRQPLEEVGKLCRPRRILVHTDATQAVGNSPISVRQLGVDLLSYTAHKFYGPKGVGGLYVRRGEPSLRLSGVLIGGGQQRGLRGGTLNVPGIVGMAEALKIAHQELADGERDRRERLRNELYHRLVAEFGPLPINGPQWDGQTPHQQLNQDTMPATGPLRIEGNLNCQFPGFDQEDLIMGAPELAISTGSACRVVDPRPSHVLLGLGLTEIQARASLRFSIGRFNDLQQIETAAEMLGRARRSIR